jgi:hypothetical protein
MHDVTFVAVNSIALFASYQVSVHLAEGFQRRRLKCEKLTDDGRRTPSDGKSSLCLWQGELKMVFEIILWFKDYCCFTIMSYNTLVYYLLSNILYLSHIPIIWRHDKIVRQRGSRATSRLSFITTVWWYNILYQTPCIRQATFFKFKGKRVIRYPCILSII